ncbi:MAG TPA: hypothetical protein VF069_17215 [Streptosporangiaceae bacterium]
MAGEARSAGLRFFLDRGLGSKILPEALRRAGWRLENGDVILCKDLKIASNPLEAQVVYMTSARVFGLANAQLTATKMIGWYLRRETEIVELAQRDHGPFVVAVHAAHRLRRVRLAYPPR